MKFGATWTLPPVVGHYRIDQFRLNFTKRPPWFHRLMMRLCFGMVWVDE